MVKTGVDGELRYNGKKVAKVRSWSLNVQRQAIDDSCLGSFDRTYVPGMRSATGSASILYDADDSATRQILNSVLKNSTDAQELDFIFDRKKVGGGFECQGFITNLSASVNIGAATACEITFQVSGKIEGSF